MGRRDPSASKTRVAFDRWRARASRFGSTRKLKVTLILDLIHARWKNCGKPLYVFHAEASLDADLWVMHRTLANRHGRQCGPGSQGASSGKVSPNAASREPKGKRWSGVAGDYSSTGTAPACAYDEYLANGWPIASGPVEGACKNLIKDRMERSAHALDRADGRGHSPAQSCLPLRRLRQLLSGNSTSNRIQETSISLQAWSGRSKIATPRSYKGSGRKKESGL